MKAMTMFTATVAGQQNNAHYPNPHTVTTAADLEAVARLDHVVAEYLGSRRSAASFVTSNCLVLDVDNVHSDDEATWVTPESLAEQLPDVAFMTATSHNHQRAKGAQSARPRFHVYFPIDPVSDAAAYAGLKKQLASRFEFFDPNAIDAGRFIYGHNAPQIMVVEGERTIDAWLADAVDEDVLVQWDDATQAIEEGSRNATLSRFAGRLLIRLGTSDEVRDLFDRKAARCNPPLPEAEVESIWRSATRFAKTVENQPGYVPPEDFEASLDSVRPAVWDFVQAEITKGARDQRTQHSTRPFSSTFECSQCGHFFGSKTWHAGSKYEKVIWRCGHKYAGQEKCATGHISDQRLKDMFLKAIRLRFGSPTDTGVNQAVLDALDTSDLEVEATGLLAQINEVAKKLQSMIAHNARVAQDQQTYEKAFNASHGQHQALLAEHAAVVAEIQNKNNRLAAYHYYRQETTNLDLEQLVFSPYLCVALLDKGTVDVDGNVTFQFRDGSTQAVAIKQ